MDPSDAGSKIGAIDVPKLNNKDSFTVDAALLQELGERLIGRPAIALAELAKNAYDADASVCQIEFKDNQIIITDNGSGMASDEFISRWMRIGTTHKAAEGRTPLGRNFTGSKGIGRLSVQFLANEMILESVSSKGDGKAVYAVVDWRSAVKGQDLKTVNVLWDTIEPTSTFPEGSKTGTRITLTQLKSTWDSTTLTELGDEVWMLRSPFRSGSLARGDRRQDQFDIEVEAPGITGAREAFDSKKKALFENWKARITGAVSSGRTKGKLAIAVEFKKDYPEGSKKANSFREAIELPVRKNTSGEVPMIDKVSFEILIFSVTGRQAGRTPVAVVREYLNEFGNVSVYDAGFRLPYYGSARGSAGQDWLSIALDQGRRLSQSALLPESLQIQNKYMEDLPALGRVFGGVEIDTNHERQIAETLKSAPGEWLQIQPGRDRLHDNRAYGQLRDLVRVSLDFYANRYRLLASKIVDEERDSEPPSQKFTRALTVLERHQDDIPTLAYKEVKREISDARKAASTEEEALDRRAALLAPLASAGMAAIALNHEVAREGRFLVRIGKELRKIAKSHSIPELTAIAEEFDDARQRLESLQELFAPLLSDVDKEATDRLKVKAIVEQTVGSMKVLMPGVEFDLSKIPNDLRFPLGSFAEWNALLQNVLANAWNAMLDSRKARIAFQGKRESNGREWLRVSDTGHGLGIPIAQTGKLFEPFERQTKISEDKRSIALGGQGLGLSIVRMIARRRSANVAFVEPQEHFSTTLEISWRGVRQ